MSNELQIKENVLDNGSQMLVSSFKMDSMEDRLKVLKATNTPDQRIKDFVNMEITIKDIYIERIVELLGNPHDWEKPIKFKVKQITKGDRSILTFEPIVK